MVWTYTAMQAAEIIYNGAGQGTEKREYVEKYIEQICAQHGIKIDMTSIRNAIETAWKDLGLDLK
jgi:hypothetical protein